MIIPILDIDITVQVFNVKQLSGELGNNQISKNKFTFMLIFLL